MAARVQFDAKIAPSEEPLPTNITLMPVGKHKTRKDINRFMPDKHFHLRSRSVDQFNFWCHISPVPFC